MAKQFLAYWESFRKFWYKNARKLVAALVGGTIVLIGIAMIVLPGPAFLVIPLGVAVIGSEFLWARRFLKRSEAFLKEKLPDSQGGRIKRTFAKVARVSHHISTWMNEHITKFLTPWRKRG